MKIKLFFSAIAVMMTGTTTAQSERWQQRIEYKMNVKLDVKTHKLTGKQEVTYYNHSLDTLNRIYYHLYFNAFQPGSMMDVRSRTIPDPDPRVNDRIAKLKDDEIGYQRIISITQEKQKLNYTITGTIMEVQLKNAILPNGHSTFNMEFESQVPVQIRRSGRNNKENIAYSMAQWYPKIAEYDYQGWHIDPYIGREFFGVWGDYDVKITLQSDFVVAGTGVLQNPNQMGQGYETDKQYRVKLDKGEKTWHFVAKNVHDFAWAADPDYRHSQVQVPNGPTVHFFYRPGDKTTDYWQKLEEYTVKHFEYMNERYGAYPYTSYSVIQAGDGGMEYPMCTFITGERELRSLVSVMAHEVTHSWYQGVLGSNESLYPWMDEGFTNFVSNESVARMFDDLGSPHQGAYRNYFFLVKRNLQEPLSTHSDHYKSNTAYGIAAYSMGEIFLEQLKYIIGEKALYRGMKHYYETWKMRHPEPNDFIRIMEKESEMQLHWYLRYWIYSTEHIDYSISRVITSSDERTRVTLTRIGQMPMPIDFQVNYRDGTSELFYIPLNETFGNKPNENTAIPRKALKAWNWVNTNYSFSINKKVTTIKSVEIDPTQRMADIDRSNNKIEINNQ